MSALAPISASMSSAEPRPVIGIVDDDPIMGESLVQRLQLEGYQAIWWQSGEEALSHLPSVDCRVLVCDIRLPDLDGEQLFRRALPDLGATPVIFITAFGEIEQAVRLMQAGADDYVTKPFEIEVLLRKIAALCVREVVAGNGNPGRETLSASAAMRVVESELLRVTDTASPVLLLGETGVGKEVAARQLHNASARRELPFVVVSCATIPVDRAESEMFGHERGGVTGSRTAHVGLVEQAGGGTLFLDEVSALLPALQGKLLRLLEDGHYRRLGGTQGLVSDARIVSSSNADLPALVARGEFPGRLVLPAERNRAAYPAAAGSLRRYHSSCGALPGTIRPWRRSPLAVLDTGRAGGVARLRLAGKCPGVAQPAWACTWPVSWRAADLGSGDLPGTGVTRSAGRAGRKSRRSARTGRTSAHRGGDIPDQWRDRESCRPARHLPDDALGKDAKVGSLV